MLKNNPPPLKTILLDMDGVIWRGYEPILDIKLLFERISALGCQAYCITNNATETVESYLSKLSGFGVDLDSSQILTSAEATAWYLTEKISAGATIYVIGEEGLKETISRKGFHITDEAEPGAVEAVVVGLDFSINYQKLYLASKIVREGALFLGTNPDKTFPGPLGLYPGGGSIISPVEAASGIKPIIIGKPEEYLYKLALKRSGSKPDQALMIGDRLDTDIQGAQRAGIKTGLVLTGVATRSDGEKWQPGLDLIGDTAFDILDMIKS